MSELEQTQDVDVLARIIGALKGLAPEERQRVIQTVATFFDLSVAKKPLAGGEDFKGLVTGRSVSPVGFTEDLGLSPKEFLFEKQPRSDVERVACLAYYLTQYRDTPQFKTIDLSKLNTEAAQPKFSNAAWAVENAFKQGYLVQGSKGFKQLSAAGEQFVRALPEREAARKVMQMAISRRRARKRVRTGANK